MLHGGPSWQDLSPCALVVAVDQSASRLPRQPRRKKDGWLLTSVQSPRAVAFYHRQDWTQATHPSPDGKGIVVFLGPRHPARALALAAQPL